jgi:CheY-like chemotaxis protein
MGFPARILLVEDNRDIREMTALLLSSIGNVEVQAFESAAAALRAVEAFRPELIILDVMMPDLDGPGALGAFRQLPATATTPVIFLTARVQPRELMRYRLLGALGVIPKPFDPERLADTIRGFWDGRPGAGNPPQGG